MINKKGMEAGFLIAIIIVIASFVLIAGVLTRWLSSADEKEAERLCHDSIAWRAVSTIQINPEGRYEALVQGKVSLVPQLCKTIDKKVKGDREKIKQQIADKMARCWWMFGEGKHDQILDSSKVAPVIYDLEEVGNKCQLCYVILTEEEKFEPIPKEEFLLYLATTKYPKVAGQTYLEYIQQHGGPGRVALLEDINPRQGYGISFLAKNEEGRSFWERLGAGTAKLGAGTIVAAAGIGALKLTGAAACAASLICGVIVAGGVVGGYLLMNAGTADLAAQVKDTFYGTERDTSIIVFDDMITSEQKCFKKDIAGE